MSEGNIDKQLREKLLKKDLDFSDELKEEMKKEEDNLKKYFRQFKKPVSKDPTVVKKSQSVDGRPLFLNQALQPFSLFYHFYQFWTIDCATPQENHTLSLCRKNMLKQMALGIGFSLMVTSVTSWRLRGVLSKKMHIFGVATALISGGLFGALSSTKFTLEQFERLGDGYELGKIARTEIDRYRMDQPINKSSR